MALNLPPGTPNVVNPAVTPTWAFTPNTSATATVRFSNTGRNPVYLGGPGVTQYTGFPLLPGGKSLELIGATQALYAASSVTAPAVQGTVGSTAITLTAAVPSGLSAGTYVLIGNTVNTGGCQAQLVASTTASSQITFANALVLDVANGDVVYSATFQPAQVQVVAGVL
jgi:hypothetical protein